MDKRAYTLQVCEQAIVCAIYSVMAIVCGYSFGYKRVWRLQHKSFYLLMFAVLLTSFVCAVAS